MNNETTQKGTNLMNIGIFKAIGDLALTAKKRRDKEHDEFLAFFRELVETLPTEVTELFGTLNGVEYVLKGAKGTAGIELTASDFMWWKRRIESEGVRFVKHPISVQGDMLERLAKRAETEKLSPDERKQMLNIYTGST